MTPPTPITSTAGLDSLNLTCTATRADVILVTPSFIWTGPEYHGPNSGTAVQGSGSMFIDFLMLGRVREGHSGTFTCLVSVANFTANASVTVVVEGGWRK